MKRIILSLFIALSGCTSEDETRRTLDALGYTDVRTHGYAWFACSQEDTFQTEFSATNPNGRKVHGVVCCGAFLRKCTVRF